MTKRFPGIFTFAGLHMFKNLQSSIFPCFIAFALLSFSACNNAPGCTDPKAENFDPSAETEDGSCISQREKFLGIYSGGNQCIGLPPGIHISEIIASNDNLTDVLISNLGGFYQGYYVRAIVDKNNLTIPYQLNPANGGSSVSGTGSIVGNSVTIQYQIAYNGQLRNCIYSMDK